MKGTPDKIYIASSERRNDNPQDLEFNLILENPPTGGIIYREYIGVSVVEEMLEKLRVVCGKRAMCYVDKQINKIKENKEFVDFRSILPPELVEAYKKAKIPEISDEVKEALIGKFISDNQEKWEEEFTKTKRAIEI